MDTAIIPASLEEFFEQQHDMARLVLSLHSKWSCLTSIRIRLVSKRLSRALDTLKHEPGYRVELYAFLPFEREEAITKYGSWLDAEDLVYIFFKTGLVHSKFKCGATWLYPRPTTLQGISKKLSFSDSLPYNTIMDNWGEYILDKELHLSHRWKRTLCYAIKGALDYQGCWFLRWMMTRGGSKFWPTEKTVHEAGFGWLLADYALRWDDPSLLIEFGIHLNRMDMLQVLVLAFKHEKTTLFQWINNESGAVADTVRALFVYDALGVASLAPVSLKRKAEEDLDRPMEEIKRPCIET